jgi:protein N-lysine methyltransferase METTL21A
MPDRSFLSQQRFSPTSDDRLLTDVTSLELGAGGGLVGLAVARGCYTTKPVIITDQLPMLNLMRQNIALNSLESLVHAEILDWGAVLSPSITSHLPLSNPPADEKQRYPDVVLAADCVYFEPAFPLLLQTLDRLVGPKTICYFCFKKRRKADWRFVRDMKRKLDVRDVEYDAKEGDRREGVYLYEVRRRID